MNQPKQSPVNGASFPGTLPPRTGSADRWISGAALALIFLALAIRVPLLVNWRLVDDEVEHLHAAWAVAQGQVPYRDFFQNHTPLLYYLMAPVFALMGEDLRIIYVGRAVMLLCILLILLQLYRIARGCFDALTGLLAVLLLSYLLLWWPSAYIFRPDIFQTLVVLVGLWRFMRAWERPSRRELVVSGALLGGGFWVLTKSLFPLVSLTLVFVLSISFRRSGAAVKENLIGLLLFLGAFAVPVALGGLLLWLADALPEFLQWGVIHAFRYPVRFSAFRQLRPQVHFVAFALALIGIVRAITRMVKARTVDEFRLSPLLAGSVTAAVYLFIMPAPNSQSALPFLPLAALYGAEVLRSVLAKALPPDASAPAGPSKSPHRVVHSPSRLARAGLVVLLLSGICAPPLYAVVSRRLPYSDYWWDRRQALRYVLALASPGDSVFDASGLPIFRPHASYYYRLGRGVIASLESGMIPETAIINDLWSSHCKVVIFSRGPLLLPQNLVRFLQSNYTLTDFAARDIRVLVAGKVLHPADLRGEDRKSVV